MVPQGPQLTLPVTDQQGFEVCQLRGELLLLPLYDVPSASERLDLTPAAQQGHQTAQHGAICSSRHPPTVTLHVHEGKAGGAAAAAAGAALLLPLLHSLKQCQDQ